jgi:hypothetical protein
MDNKRVIYATDVGGVAVIVPAPGATQEQVLQAVPVGKAYKIVDVADVPSDRTFRSAWEVNEAALTDGVGADSNEFTVEVTE